MIDLSKMTASPNGIDPPGISYFTASVSGLVLDTGMWVSQLTFRQNSPDVSYVSGSVTIIYNCNVAFSCSPVSPAGVAQTISTSSKSQ
jgi:hypothetical protein